jgi:hypothetical protein
VQKLQPKVKLLGISRHIKQTHEGGSMLVVQHRCRQMLANRAPCRSFGLCLT